MRSNLKMFPNYSILYLSLFFISCISYLKYWPVVRLIGAKQEKDFGDTGIILNATDCFEEIGLDVYKAQSGKCSYNYGESLIRILHILNLDGESTKKVGITFVVLFIIAFVECIRIIQPVASLKNQIIATMFFLSPPVMLLLERGNFDTLIFFLLVIAVILRVRKKYTLSNLILIISILFKFYTFPVFLYFLYIDLKIGKVKKSNILALVACIMFMVQDLYRIAQGFSIPNPMWFAFGSSKYPWALARILGIDLPRYLQLVLGAVISWAVLFGIYKFGGNSIKLRELKDVCLAASLNSQLMSKCMALIFVVNYLTGMSYIYRLIFAIPVFIFLLTCQNVPSFYTSIPIVGAILLSPWFGGLEFIGDLLLLWLVPLIIWIYFPKLRKVEISSQIKSI